MCRILFLWTLIFIGSGCAGISVLPDSVPSTLRADGREAETLFPHDLSGLQPPTETLESEHEDYTIFRLHFADRPSVLFPGHGVTAYEYRPKRDAPSPGAGLLLLPIQGANYEVSTYFAEYFASRGLSCLRFERRAEWLIPERPLEQLALLIREYVVDIRRGLAWWQASGHVDKDRVGLFGVSMGAIIGSMVSALEGSNVKASVLVIGGGSIADILMTADDEEIGETRNKWIARFENRDQLEQKLHQVLDPVDPLRLAPLIPAASTLMIHARFDHVVRYPLCTSIWEAAGKPERVVIPTGHYSSVLFIRYIRWKAYKWFEGLLSVDD